MVETFCLPLNDLFSGEVFSFGQLIFKIFCYQP